MASTVFVRSSTGIVYAYENISYWDKVSKRTKHKRKCIGHVDPITKTIVPNHKKNLKQLAPTVLGQNCTVSGNGIALLLDHIAEETELTKTLKQIFPDIWQKIMTCAYYLISEGTALSRIEKWSEVNTSPCNSIITSQRVSELLLQIPRSRQLEFFTKWIQVNQSKEYYAMDITSISSYSELIDFVRYGYNRDGEELPQVNMLMVSGENSHIPLYFKVLPGSIKDVNTLTDSLQTLHLIDAKALHLVMDKGFYSKDNIDAMYDKHIKFMIGVPFTVGFAKEQVEKARAEDIMAHENFRLIFGDEVFVKSSLTNWNGHRLYVHVYYDSLKAELAYKKFNRLLYVCREELASDQTCKAHEQYYKKYFTVKETPKRGRKVEYNQTAIDDHRKNATGWFVLVTNEIKDSVKALEIYRRKDAVEKTFDDLKNDLDCKRLRIHSNEAMDGRLFIQYVALILSAKIKCVMNEANWFKNYNMQQVVDEMKSMRQVKIEGSHNTLTSTLTAFQQKIIKLFGLVM